jgi:hypothetical protein
MSSFLDYPITVIATSLSCLFLTFLGFRVAGAKIEEVKVSSKKDEKKIQYTDHEINESQKVYNANRIHYNTLENHTVKHS